MVGGAARVGPRAIVGVGAGRGLVSHQASTLPPAACPLFCLPALILPADPSLCACEGATTVAGGGGGLGFPGLLCELLPYYCHATATLLPGDGGGGGLGFPILLCKHPHPSPSSIQIEV